MFEKLRTVGRGFVSLWAHFSNVKGSAVSPDSDSEAKAKLYLLEKEADILAENLISVCKNTGDCKRCPIFNYCPCLIGDPYDKETWRHAIQLEVEAKYGAAAKLIAGLDGAGKGEKCQSS